MKFDDGAADIQAHAHAILFGGEKRRKQVFQVLGADAAAVVGKAIAERALAKGVTTISFDRSGFQYHGRVAALAAAAREAGLQF